MNPNSTPENLNGATTHHTPNADASTESVPQITVGATKVAPTPDTATEVNKPFVPSETPELPLVKATDVFWPNPKVLDKEGVAVIGWITPPTVEGESDKTAELLKDDHPFQAAALLNKAGVAKKAGEELDLLQVNLVEELNSANRIIFRDNQEVKGKIAPLQTKLEAAQEEAFGARKKSLEALEVAGLPFDAQDIRSAVEAVAPNEEVISGRAGVIRQPEEFPSWALTWAPVVIGAIVGALTLGPLLNIFYPSDLGNLDEKWPQLLIASICGAILVEVLGIFASRFAQNLAPYLLAREAEEVPRRDTFRRGIKHRLGAALLAVGLFIAGALFLSAIAEVTLGSVGIHMASEEHVNRALRNMPTTDGKALTTVTPPESLPWLLCIAVAIVFVTPFLYAKVLGVWSKVENGMIRDWIAAQREAWITARLAEPEVKEAAGALGRERSIRERVMFFNDSIAALISQIQPYKTELTKHDRLRLEAARVAASGEAGELRDTIRVIANAKDPIKTERVDLPSSNPILHNHTKATLPWWRRLFAGKNSGGRKQGGNLKSREL